MTGEPSPGVDARSGGMLEHARELLAAGLDYIQARLTLAGIEAKEAMIHFGIIVGLFAGAVAVILFGYLFACIALTVLLAQLLGISPGWVILALAIVHFVAAATAIICAIVKLKTSVFAVTLEELRKDRQWLKQAAKQN